MVSGLAPLSDPSALLDTGNLRAYLGITRKRRHPFGEMWAQGEHDYARTTPQHLARLTPGTIEIDADAAQSNGRWHGT